MDLIGKVFPPSSKGHSYIFVITDFFTKWADAVTLKFVNQQAVIKILKENIVHRFGLPQHLVADRGPVFFG